MPWPTGLVVKNGSKMRAWTSGSMPTPVSLTLSCTYSPQRDADAAVPLGVRLVQLGDLGRDGDPAAALHRIAGVEHEVHQHLLELAAVGPDLARLWRERELQAMILAQRRGAASARGRARPPLTGRTSGRRNCWRVKARSWRVTSAARVPALMISRTSARRGSSDLEAAEQKLAEADDPGHHVVDLVRDAAGEAPRRLHPLRAPELVLHPLALGHVPVDAAELRRVAVVGRAAEVALERERHALRRDQDEIHVPDALAGLGAGDDVEVPVAAVGMHQIDEASRRPEPRHCSPWPSRQAGLT